MATDWHYELQNTGYKYFYTRVTSWHDHSKIIVLSAETQRYFCTMPALSDNTQQRKMSVAYKTILNHTSTSKETIVNHGRRHQRSMYTVREDHRQASILCSFVRCTDRINHRCQNILSTTQSSPHIGRLSNISHVDLYQANTHARALLLRLADDAGGCDCWRWLRLCRRRRSSSDIVITFTRRRGGSRPAGRTGTGQRRTRCKSIRALRPAPRAEGERYQWRYYSDRSAYRSAGRVHALRHHHSHRLLLKDRLQVMRNIHCNSGNSYCRRSNLYTDFALCIHESQLFLPGF